MGVQLDSNQKEGQMYTDSSLIHWKMIICKTVPFKNPKISRRKLQSVKVVRILNDFKLGRKWKFNLIQART